MVTGIALVGALAVLVPGHGSAVTGTTLVVGSFTDDPALQSCSATSNPRCSLRGALELARSQPGVAVTVKAPPGTYTLNPANGAFLIATSVTLTSTTPGGSSADQVVLDGAQGGVGTLVVDGGQFDCQKVSGSPAATTAVSTGTNCQGPTPGPLPAITVQLTNVTVQHGSLTTGGFAGVSAAPHLVGPVARAVDAAGLDVISSGPVNLTMTDVLVQNNTASTGGGVAGLFTGTGVTAALDQVTVAGNSFTGAGDGIGGAVASGPLTLVNTTITGNTGTQVGGLLFLGRTGIAFSTIADNVDTRGAKGTANGIAIGGQGPFTVESTILSNPAGTVSGCSGTARLTSLGGNIDGDGTCLASATAGDQVGTARTRLDPQLQSLLNNAGAVPTRGIPASSIAAGRARTCAPVGVGAGTDARGVPRPDLISSSGTHDGTCDVGAFEIQTASTDPGIFQKGPQPPPGGFTPEFSAGGTAIPDPVPVTGATITGIDPINPAVTVSVFVPGPGATDGAPPGLPGGTQIAFYHGDAPALTQQVPSGQTAVDGYAVAWVTPNGARPPAARTLILTVKDPLVPGTGTLYLCVIAASSACTTTVPGSTVVAGQWTAPFTADPGFALAEAAAAPPSTGGPVLAPPATGGAAASPDSGTPAPPLVTASLVGAGLAGLRWRRRRGAPPPRRGRAPA